MLQDTIANLPLPTTEVNSSPTGPTLYLPAASGCPRTYQMALDTSVLAREQKHVLLLARSMMPSCPINTLDINAACILLSTFEGVISSSDQDQVSENKQVQRFTTFSLQFLFHVHTINVRLT